MSGVYSMSSGPSYAGASPQELFDSAMDQPLSLASTFFDQAKGGALDSFYLGALTKKIMIDPGAPIAANRGESPESYFARRNAAQPLTEDQYKASPSFRSDIPWDQAMTETRAAALADWNDAKKVREFYASKRPISSFFGSMAGQALDPINYIPVGGPLVKAAAIGRFGRIGGEAATAAIDAATNTAVFGIATSQDRAQYGDDVSWQSTVSQIATAAMIGAAFGTLGGAVGKRVEARTVSEAERRLATLRTTQEARIALNEGIDALANGNDIRLSPNSTDPLARVTSDVAKMDTPIRAPEATATIPQAEADATLVSVGHDVKQLEAKGVDTPTVLRSASPQEAARVAQIEEIATLREQVAAAVKEVATVADENAPAQAVQDATVAPEARIAQIASSAERLKTLEDHAAKGEVAPDLVKAVEDRRKAAAPAPEGGQAQSLEARPKATSLVGSYPVDTTAARPISAPEGIRQAETTLAKPEDTRNLAEQYRVDPKTGSFAEEGEVAQLAAEGRLTAEDAATLAQAQADYETGSAYAEALKAVSGCLI